MQLEKFRKKAQPSNHKAKRSKTKEATIFHHDDARARKRDVANKQETNANRNPEKQLASAD